MRLGIVAVAIAAAVAAGCAASGAGRGAEGAQGPPAGDPPSLGSSDDAPPPAWIETSRGSFWLGFSTFFWDGLCADYAAPSCGQTHVPPIEVRDGESVRVHLGFDPRELSVTTSVGGGAQDRLVAERVAVWRAREGAFSVFAVRRKGGGDASYVGCAVVDR